MIHRLITNFMVICRVKVSAARRKAYTVVLALAFWLFYAISTFAVVYSFVGWKFIPFNFDIVLWASIVISFVLFIIYSILGVKSGQNAGISGKAITSLIISAIVTFLFGFAIGHTVEATVARGIALGIFMIYAPLLIFRLAGIALYPAMKVYQTERYAGNSNKPTAISALKVKVKWDRAMEAVWIILCLAMAAFVGFTAYKMFF